MLLLQLLQLLLLDLIYVAAVGDADLAIAAPVPLLLSLLSPDALLSYLSVLSCCQLCQLKAAKAVAVCLVDDHLSTASAIGRGAEDISCVIKWGADGLTASHLDNQQHGSDYSHCYHLYRYSLAVSDAT